MRHNGPARANPSEPMTSWKKIGETSPINWRKNDAIKTSRSGLRNLTSAGMNQLISNGRVAPAIRSRLVINMNRPVAIAAKTSGSMTSGRGASPRWTRMRLASFSSTFRTMTAPPSIASAIAGSGRSESASEETSRMRATRPRRFEDRAMSSSVQRSTPRPRSCASCPASAGMPRNLASKTKQASVESSPLPMLGVPESPASLPDAALLSSRAIMDRYSHATIRGRTRQQEVQMKQ